MSDARKREVWKGEKRLCRWSVRCPFPLLVIGIGAGGEVARFDMALERGKVCSVQLTWTLFCGWGLA
jgi:hypothetical protein